jgi:hypothetical protein
MMIRGGLKIIDKKPTSAERIPPVPLYKGGRILSIK